MFSGFDNPLYENRAQADGVRPNSFTKFARSVAKSRRYPLPPRGSWKGGGPFLHTHSSRSVGPETIATYEAHSLAVGPHTREIEDLRFP